MKTSTPISYSGRQVTFLGFTALFCTLQVATVGFGQEVSNKYRRTEKIEVQKGSTQFRGEYSIDEQGANKNLTISHQEQRTWTDASGKFRVKAVFRGIAGDDLVILESPNGKRIKISRTKLSDGDQKYVTQKLAVQEENPFQPFTGPKASVPGLKSSASASIQEAKWQNAKTVKAKNFSRWEWQPITNSENVASNHSDFSKTTLRELPDSKKFFEKILELRVSADCTKAILIREQGAVASDTAVYAEIVDLKNSQSETMVQLGEEIKVLDVLSEYGLLLYRSETTGFGKESLLKIDRIVPDRLAPIARWKPYIHEEWEPNRDIENAWFLSPERVMTINHLGESLTVWNIASATAEFSIPVRNSVNLKMAFNHNREMLAIVMEDGVALIDVVAGKHVATIATNSIRYHSVGFNNSNNLLVGVSDGHIAAWDLTTGNKQSEFMHSAIRSHSSVDWAGDFLLLDHRLLFDLERRILLWEYHNSLGHIEKSVFVGEALHYILPIKDGNPTQLFSIHLPHQEAIEVAQQLRSPKDLLVVKPGDAIAIELEIDSHIGSEGEVRESLKQNLESAGFKVVDKSNLVLKGICKRQEKQTMRINTDNRWPIRKTDIVERSIAPHASFLSISLNGEEVWEQGTIARPGHVFYIQQGETLDQALERLTQPNLDLLKNAVFPTSIAQPGSEGVHNAYGASNLTRTGIVDNSSENSF